MAAGGLWDKRFTAKSLVLPFWVLVFLGKLKTLMIGVASEGVALRHPLVLMSYFDIAPKNNYSGSMSMNVSLGSLEEFVRQKVDQGEYESASEMVRDGLRLLKRREELWQAKIRAKIEEGMASLREGRTIPGEEAWPKLQAWREAQRKQHGL